jgi:hypothetical protein
MQKPGFADCIPGQAYPIKNLPATAGRSISFGMIFQKDHWNMDLSYYWISLLISFIGTGSLGSGLQRVRFVKDLVYLGLD